MVIITMEKLGHRCTTVEATLWRCYLCRLVVIFQAFLCAKLFYVLSLDAPQAEQAVAELCVQTETNIATTNVTEASL